MGISRRADVPSFLQKDRQPIAAEREGVADEKHWRKR
jgi:hypothetical protein